MPGPAFYSRGNGELQKDGVIFFGTSTDSAAAIVSAGATTAADLTLP